MFEQKALKKVNELYKVKNERKALALDTFGIDVRITRLETALMLLNRREFAKSVSLIRDISIKEAFELING